MSPDLSSAVLLADDLLGGIVAAYPEFAGERDMHLDLETGPAVDDQPPAAARLSSAASLAR